MSNKIDLLPLLDFIDPSTLDYSSWTAVGMALKQEGYTASDWDSWSRRDSKRYHSGECFKKWGSFNGSSTPVTAGTIVELAKAGGEGGLAHVAAGCRRRDVLLFIDGDEEAQQSQVQHGDTIVNSDDNQRKTIFIADGCSDYSDWVPCWPALV